MVFNGRGPSNITRQILSWVLWLETARVICEIYRFYFSSPHVFVGKKLSPLPPPLSLSFHNWNREYNAYLIEDAISSQLRDFLCALRERSKQKENLAVSVLWRYGTCIMAATHRKCTREAPHCNRTRSPCHYVALFFRRLIFAMSNRLLSIVLSRKAYKVVGGAVEFSKSRPHSWIDTQRLFYKVKDGSHYPPLFSGLLTYWECGGGLVAVDRFAMFFRVRLGRKTNFIFQY